MPPTGALEGREIRGEDYFDLRVTVTDDANQTSFDEIRVFEDESAPFCVMSA